MDRMKYDSKNSKAEHPSTPGEPRPHNKLALNRGEYPCKGGHSSPLA